jgi:hypothetical protein
MRSGLHRDGANGRPRQWEVHEMTFSLTWIPEVLEDAGLKVAEQPGWRTTNRDGHVPGAPSGPRLGRV